MKWVVLALLFLWQPLILANLQLRAQFPAFSDQKRVGEQITMRVTSDSGRAEVFSNSLEFSVTQDASVNYIQEMSINTPFIEMDIELGVYTPAIVQSRSVQVHIFDDFVDEIAQENIQDFIDLLTSPFLSATGQTSDVTNLNDTIPRSLLPQLKNETLPSMRRRMLLHVQDYHNEEDGAALGEEYGLDFDTDRKVWDKYHHSPRLLHYMRVHYQHIRDHGYYYYHDNTLPMYSNTSTLSAQQRRLLQLDIPVLPPVGVESCISCLESNADDGLYTECCYNGICQVGTEGLTRASVKLGLENSRQIDTQKGTPNTEIRCVQLKCASTSFSELTMTTIRDSCEAALSSCYTSAEGANGTQEQQTATEECDDLRNTCVLSSICRSTDVCRAPTGFGSAVDLVSDQCTMNVLSEVVMQTKVKLRSAQSQKLIWYKVWFQRTINNVRGYTNAFANYVKNLPNSTEEDVMEFTNQFKSVLSEMDGLLNDTESLIENATDVMERYTKKHAILYANFTGLAQDLLTHISSLGLANTLIEDMLKSSTLAIMEQNELGAINILGNQQKAAVAFDTMSSLLNILVEIQRQDQVAAALSSAVQTAINDMISRTALVPFLYDRGLGPRALSLEERYQWLGTYNYFWLEDRLVNASTVRFTRRTAITYYCDIQQFAFDLAPRNNIQDPQGWLGSAGCEPSDPQNPFAENSDLNCRCFLQAIEMESDDSVLGEPWVKFGNESEVPFVYFDTSYEELNMLQPNDTDSSGFWTVRPNGVQYRYTTTPVEDYLQNDICLVDGVTFPATSLEASTLVSIRGALQQPNLTGVDDLLPMRMTAAGQSNFLLLMGGNASLAIRPYCTFGTENFDIWNTEATLNLLGAPMPVVLYEAMVRGMRGLETLIRNTRTELMGILPRPLSIRDFHGRYTMGQDSQNRSVNAQFMETNARLSGLHPQETELLAYKTHEAVFVGTSVNAIPCWKVFNRQVRKGLNIGNMFRDGMLTNSTSSVLQVQWEPEEGDLIPSQFYMCSYPGCFRNKCPDQITLLDVSTGTILGTASEDGDGPAYGFQPHDVENVSDVESGFSNFLYDVPQSAMSFSKNSIDRAKTVTYHAEFVNGLQNPTESLGRIYETYQDGVIVQRPTISISKWARQTIGDYEARDATLSLHQFKQTYEWGTPLNASVIGQDIIIKPLSYKTDIRCTGTRRNLEEGICTIADKWFIDFDGARGTIRFYPRQWEYLATVRLRPELESLGMNDLQVRVGGSDVVGRQISGCPELVQVVNKETDLTQVLIDYYTLPPQNITLKIEASQCLNTTGGGGVKLISSADLNPFETYVLAIPGCSGQEVAVSVIPNDPLQNITNCLLWQGNPQPVSQDTIRANVVRTTEAKKDALSALFFAVGKGISEAVNAVAPVLSLGFQEAMMPTSASLNGTTQGTLEGFDLIIDQFESELDLLLASQNSNEQQMLAQLDVIREALDNSTLNTTAIDELLMRIEGNATELLEFAAQEEELRLQFVEINNELNRFLEAYANPTLILGGAPAGYNYSELGLLIFTLSNITCPAIWAQPELFAEYEKAFNDEDCDGNTFILYRPFVCTQSSEYVFSIFLVNLLIVLTVMGTVLIAMISKCCTTNFYCDKDKTDQQSKATRRRLRGHCGKEGPDSRGAACGRVVMVAFPLTLFITLLITFVIR